MSLGWLGFWIAGAIIIATEEVVEYLRWKTEIEYGIEKKKHNWMFWKK